MMFEMLFEVVRLSELLCNARVTLQGALMRADHSGK